MRPTDTPDGLDILLSDGRADRAPAPRLEVAKTETLSDARTRALLSRLSPLATAEGDKKPFALRDRSQPPPRTGETVTTPFPPPAGDAPPAAEASAGELTVVRFAPEGDVPLAANVNLTFSLPMVAVTGVEDTLAGGVPVTMTPEAPGAWRWVGTRTLVFEPEVRLPQATSYTVTVPAGTRAASGATLAEATTFSFTTPAPRVVERWPLGPGQRIDTPMFLAFDQRVDREQIVAGLRIEAGGKRFAARLLTSDEIAADRSMKQLVDAAVRREHEDRYVAFRAVEPLPKDTNVAITVPTGTASAEGPRTTTADQSFSFRTYAPLRIISSRCGWGNDCPPGSPFFVEFNNELDVDAFDKSSLRFAPAIPGLRIEAFGSNLELQGRTKGRTNYELTIPGALRDTFGQTLGEDKTLSFRTGSARPQLSGPDGLVVADPSAKTPTVNVFSINQPKLRVALYRVSPEDWEAFSKHRRDALERKTLRWRVPPGKKIFEQAVETAGAKDELIETRIDLSPALSNGLGHVIAAIEGTEHEKNEPPPRVLCWVQATRIGLDAFVDNGEVVAWANRLADGAPLADVALALEPTSTTGITDANGVARLPLPAEGTGQAQLLVARRGDDVAFIAANPWGWGGRGWSAQESPRRLTWYVTDDRHIYKPGETVHLKGWVRVLDFGKGGDVEGPGTTRGIRYKVVGPQGNELGSGVIKVNALGGFDSKFTLPDTPNLGYAQVQLTAIGSKLGEPSYRHSFQIQEFRTPEYEVTVETSGGPHLVGGHAEATVKAKYYAGGGLADAEASWSVTSSPGTFVPPNRGDWNFGPWMPWWGDWRIYGQGGNETYFNHSGKTDASGKHVLRMDFASVNPPRPMEVRAQASVTDVNRQAWAASATLLVHPSELYIGVKTGRTFVDRGTPIELETLVVDHDGEAVTGKSLTVRAARLDWTFKDGEYVTEEVDPQVCELTSASDASDCRFETPEGGQYEITARVTDDAGRANETTVRVWVSGGKQPPKRKVEQEKVTLVPDKQHYAPGDTARILVQAPFAPAEGILTVRRSGIVDSRRFTMTDSSVTLEVPIADSVTPNVFVQVDLVGATARVDDDGKLDPGLPKRPAFASGQLKLSVPPKNRELTVEATPGDRKLEPGGKTPLSLDVRDRAGKPVANAELAVIVVDEAVLSLSNFKLANPLDLFYPERSAGVRDHHLRAQLELAAPDSVAAAPRGGGGRARKAQAATGMAPPAPEAEAMDMMRVGAAPGSAAAPATPITVRSNFAALATFAPAVRTDDRGRATVEIELPDNLTRYRIMVAAVAGDRLFGKGESSITARLPLMVRPSPPRFLNFGDRFELPVVVQNQTDEALEVEVAVRAGNAALTAGAGRRLTVAANDRVEVRFPSAAELPGVARFQLAASAGTWSDAAEVALPVWTPATTEAFATYGEIDSGAIKQPVAAPSNAVREFGGLEITTSSTQLQALTDAFLYLVSYPYECSEQVASRVLAVAALRDVLSAFDVASMPTPAELVSAVERDLERLESLQNGDGGFSFWSRGHTSWPYLTIHVGNALARAKGKGFAVPQTLIDNTLRYLREIEGRIPREYPDSIRHTLTAYALYVRSLHGDRDLAAARALFDKAGGTDKLHLEAQAWLLGVMAGDPASKAERAAINRHLLNKATETAAAATFSTSYSDGAHLILHSSRRADGIILESLIADSPKSDLVPKIVRGLLAHRRRGRWGNTQENAFVLLALDRYFQEYEKVTPRFVARAWLGDGFAGEHRFAGRTTERHQIDVPMDYLAGVGATDLTLAKEGKGRMYYRIGMTYAPSDLQLGAVDRGFAVERSYETVDDPGDVARGDDGTWTIKAGARVRVRLTMVAQSRRYHVALVDPMPAGFEPLNPALAVTGEVPTDSGSKPDTPFWWWFRPWYEHQNLRDERVEAFSSLVWAGVHEYTYVARATTPGEFVVPPAKAEEMYAPETFGRTASTRVVIK